MEGDAENHEQIENPAAAGRRPGGHGVHFEGEKEFAPSCALLSTDRSWFCCSPPQRDMLHLGSTNFLTSACTRTFFLLPPPPSCLSAQSPG